MANIVETWSYVLIKKSHLVYYKHKPDCHREHVTMVKSVTERFYLITFFFSEL